MDKYKGTILICIDNDSQDEDLGMSGIVLRGNHVLKLGKEYEVENVSYYHVPKNSRRSIMAGEPDEKIWTDKEYELVKWSYTQFWIKGVALPQWGHHFKIKSS